MAGAKITSTLNMTPLAKGGFYADLKTKISKSINGNQISLQGQANTKEEGKVKGTYLFGLFNKILKIKIGLEGDYRKNVLNYNGSIETLYKLPFSNVITYIPFIKQFDNIITGNLGVKSVNLDKKELRFRSHFVTTSEHKAHLEYKVKREKEKDL